MGLEGELSTIWKFGDTILPPIVTEREDDSAMPAIANSRWGYDIGYWLLMWNLIRIYHMNHKICWFNGFTTSGAIGRINKDFPYFFSPRHNFDSFCFSFFSTEEWSLIIQNQLNHLRINASQIAIHISYQRYLYWLHYGSTKHVRKSVKYGINITIINPVNRM